MKTGDCTELKHVLIQPKIYSMLTGVISMEWLRDTAILVYTDGSKESCPMELKEFHALGETPFSLVSTVQERARKEVVR